ncbi:GntR family transcriptional regulator [Conservatibacter flavescens]|uniref:GntR family transcriptional regulator n=1 Tax=Conservatibacter flavescens TaxID=28161 RepID=A0A2M8S5B4_9PAST|nr:GntR family transcriptional regulator [Conservatibacter flavescens]PJG86313.1 GntR family transcriptional regulator [Conservatibacter flavescens]
MNNIILLKDIIYHRIHHMIITGVLPMGSKISESFLMEKLNATKSPIRDAIKKLEAEKLLIRKPKSGTFVFTINQKELEELLDFRYCLESNALKLVHKNHNTKVLVQQLRLIFDKMIVCYENAQINEYINLDYQFHNTIITHSNNSYYIESYNLINARMAAILTYLKNDVSHIQRGYKQHENMIVYLENNDIDRANQELLHHISPEHGAYWRLENIKK